MAARLRLDHAGIEEMLKSAEVAGVIDDAAAAVASGVSETARDGQAVPVEVDSYTTDRAAAGVTMAHPAGLGIEAKRGTLSRAAAAAGLEVSAGAEASQLLDYVTASGRRRKATRAQVDNWTRGRS